MEETFTNGLACILIVPWLAFFFLDVMSQLRICHPIGSTSNYAYSAMRITVSIIEWAICIVYGYYYEPRYLFHENHCGNFLIVCLTCFGIYALFYPILMPDIRLIDNIPVRSKLGYAYLGNIGELDVVYNQLQNKVLPKSCVQYFDLFSIEELEAEVSQVMIRIETVHADNSFMGCMIALNDKIENKLREISKTEKNFYLWLETQLQCMTNENEYPNANEMKTLSLDFIELMNAFTKKYNINNCIVVTYGILRCEIILAWLKYIKLIREIAVVKSMDSEELAEYIYGGQFRQKVKEFNENGILFDKKGLQKQLKILKNSNSKELKSTIIMFATWVEENFHLNKKIVEKYDFFSIRRENLEQITKTFEARQAEWIDIQLFGTAYVLKRKIVGMKQIISSKENRNNFNRFIINEISDFWKGCLDYAAQNGQIETQKWLQDRGATYN